MITALDTILRTSGKKEDHVLFPLLTFVEFVYHEFWRYYGESMSPRNMILVCIILREFALIQTKWLNDKLTDVAASNIVDIHAFSVFNICALIILKRQF